MQNKVLFYRNDLRKFNLPANLPSLGLLQAVEGLTLLSKSLSYNFLHLSIQELLAAYHISHIDSIANRGQYLNACLEVLAFKLYNITTVALLNLPIQRYKILFLLKHNKNQVLKTFYLCSTASMKHKNHLCAS